MNASLIRNSLLLIKMKFMRDSRSLLLRCKWVPTGWQVIIKRLLITGDRVLLQIISQFCGWFQSAQRVFRSFLGWGSPLAQLSISIQQVNLTIPNDDDFDRFLSQENEIHSFKMIECRLSLYGKTSTHGQPNSIGHQNFDIS